MPRLCAVNGCEEPHYCKSYCRKHYSRWKAHGDPHAGRVHAPIEVRFWRFVDRKGPDDCWPWTGKRQKSGYGRIGEGEKQQYGAHRISFRIHNGFDPEVVMHTCDNPWCVNPKHLLAGTREENIADMVAKNRHRNTPMPGARHPAARITEDDVRAIRATTERLADVAVRYGLSRGAIDKIRSRENWKHVT